MRRGIIGLMFALAGAIAALSTGMARQPSPQRTPPPTPAPALRIRAQGVSTIKDLDLSLADLKALPHRSVTVQESAEKK